MQITFVPAKEEDAKNISKLRAEIWNTTYRGIYRDELIDHYDFAYHESRDLQRIRDNSYHVYLILDRDNPIGYFYFQDDGEVHIQSLYVLLPYQNNGIGKEAFEIARAYCRNKSYKEFTCNCNQHNYKARAFYEHIGGRNVYEDFGHEDKRQDQITYLFDV